MFTLRFCETLPRQNVLSCDRCMFKIFESSAYICHSPQDPTYTIVALRHILSYFGLRIHNL